MIYKSKALSIYQLIRAFKIDIKMTKAKKNFWRIAAASF
jgi:hypothetical protein